MTLFLLINGWTENETVRISKTYDVTSAKELNVMINNVYGDVKVEASTSGKVELELDIEINASNDKELERAKRELKLGEYLKTDTIAFYTKAPFIRECDKPWQNTWWGDDQPGYSFKYHYTVKIPAQARLKASTVNDGEVIIGGIQGPIKAGNVNGGLEIRDAHEVISASSVNGDVTVTFVKAPKKSIDFNTVNGDFNLEFPNNLAAKVYFDTMNGEMYTAFDYKPAQTLVQESSKGSKYKISTQTGVEIGSGGPTLTFKSINGNVYINKK